MSELKEIADRLIDRANGYQEPYGGSPDWVNTSSYTIATALREMAYAIQKVSDSEQLQDDDQ